MPSLFYNDTSAQPSIQSSSLSGFPRHEVNAGIRNGIQVNVSAHTQSKADYKGLLDNSSDIQKVTYSSNGSALNATLWLGGVVRGTPSIYGARTVAYGILVDADNNPTTGKFGVDYQKEIQWNNKTKNWNKLFVEYSINNLKLLTWPVVSLSLEETLTKLYYSIYTKLYRCKILDKISK